MGDIESVCLIILVFVSIDFGLNLFLSQFLSFFLSFFLDFGFNKFVSTTIFINLLLSVCSRYWVELSPTQDQIYAQSAEHRIRWLHPP